MRRVSQACVFVTFSFLLFLMETNAQLFLVSIFTKLLSLNNDFTKWLTDLRSNLLTLYSTYLLKEYSQTCTYGHAPFNK